MRAETLSINGDAIDKLASLGSRATGAEIEWIVTPDELLGLPASFPVAIVHGDKPEVRSVKALADEYRLYPEFRRGVAQVGDVASLIDLLNRTSWNRRSSSPVSDWKKPSLTAVINYHDLARKELGQGDRRLGQAPPALCLPLLRRVEDLAGA